MQCQKSVPLPRQPVAFKVPLCPSKPSNGQRRSHLIWHHAGNRLFGVRTLFLLLSAGGHGAHLAMTPRACRARGVGKCTYHYISDCLQSAQPQKSLARAEARNFGPERLEACFAQPVRPKARVSFIATYGVVPLQRARHTTAFRLSTCSSLRAVLCCSCL